MDIDFSSKEVIFLYGTLKKRIKNLKHDAALPKLPVNKSSITTDIRLFESIIKKLEAAYPALKQMSIE